MRFLYVLKSIFGALFVILIQLQFCWLFDVWPYEPQGNNASPFDKTGAADKKAR